jgi:hypothetical protein
LLPGAFVQHAIVFSLIFLCVLFGLGIVLRKSLPKALLWMLLYSVLNASVALIVAICQLYGVANFTGPTGFMILIVSISLGFILAFAITATAYEKFLEQSAVEGTTLTARFGRFLLISILTTGVWSGLGVAWTMSLQNGVGISTAGLLLFLGFWLGTRKGQQGLFNAGREPVKWRIKLAVVTVVFIALWVVVTESVPYDVPMKGLL